MNFIYFKNINNICLIKDKLKLIINSYIIENIKKIILWIILCIWKTSYNLDFEFGLS